MVYSPVKLIFIRIKASPLALDKSLKWQRIQIRLSRHDMDYVLFLATVYVSDVTVTEFWPFPFRTTYIICPKLSKFFLSPAVVHALVGKAGKNNSKRAKEMRSTSVDI